MENNFLPDEIRGGDYSTTAVTQVEQSRAVAEVMGAMKLAKMFPRDEISAEAKILKECERKSLAEVAQYAYPRGGTTVEGPSIRLAEVMARCWGNILYGLAELSQTEGVSEVEAYAWDLETNTKASRRFQVKHVRRARGQNYDLSDPRDIYEMVASQGQRRVRACILEVIPGDIQDKAVAQCNKTLTSAYSEPLEDRITAMVRAFDKLGVPQQAIERRLNHVVNITTETELASLKKIYSSIKDGMAKREDYFDLGATQGETVRERLDELKKKPEEHKDIPPFKTTEGEFGDPEPKDKTVGEVINEQKKGGFRSEWVNMRGGDGVKTGFVGYVVKNIDRIIAHPEHWDEMKAKWEKLYPDQPHIVNEWKDAPEPTDEQLSEEPEPAMEMGEGTEYNDHGGVVDHTEDVPHGASDPVRDQIFSSSMFFSQAMRTLYHKNGIVYTRIMAKHGYEDSSDIPANKRETVYNEIKETIYS